MGRTRRGRPGLGLPVALLLVAGACAGVCGLFMPWISIEAGLLNFLGIVPEAPVHGYRIPALVRDSGGHPMIQGGAATQEILSGRLDLAAARLLFGERYETDWAPVVLLPVVWCLVCLALMLRLPRIASLRKTLAVISLIVFAGMAAAALRLSGEAATGSLLSPTLAIHEGVWITLVATGLTLAGSLLSLRKRR